jgi:hypothetical protein
MSNPATAENGVVHLHAGIQAGVGDLTPAVHGRVNPVAEMSVTAIND